MQQAGAYQWDFVTPGLPDGAFEHAPGFSPTPMELRVMLLAHLRPRPDSLVWDVGGGTGALALEIARLMPQGAVHTLERDPDAIRLLEQNRQRFGIANLHIHAGQAPHDLQQLPAKPDRVLLEVGRPLGDVLLAVWDALVPQGRLVISTASLRAWWMPPTPSASWRPGISRWFRPLCTACNAAAARPSWPQRSPCS